VNRKRKRVYKLNELHNSFLASPTIQEVVEYYTILNVSFTEDGEIQNLMTSLTLRPVDLFDFITLNFERIPKSSLGRDLSLGLVVR